MLDRLPDELLGNIVAQLDYRSAICLAQTSKVLASIILDDSLLWYRIFETTFDAPFVRRRHGLPDEQIKSPRQVQEPSYKQRIRGRREALSQFLKLQKDVHAPTLLALFYEMGSRNAAFIRSASMATTELNASHQELDFFHLLSHSMSWRSMEANDRRRDRNRFEQSTLADEDMEDPSWLKAKTLDPRSDLYLAMMLYMRFSGYSFSKCVPNGIVRQRIPRLLTTAGAIVYDSVSYPLFHFPPHMIQQPPRDMPALQRYNLRSQHAPLRLEPVPALLREPCINWGVVETILQMVSVYREVLHDHIPGFEVDRDQLEHDVPMEASMFDAGLAGCWRGVYAYRDFREFQTLHAPHASGIDYFDGVQEVVIEEEEEVETFKPSVPGNEDDVEDMAIDTEDPAVWPQAGNVVPGDETDGEDETEEDDAESDDAEERRFWTEADHLDQLQDLPFRRFTANSVSRHHQHRHHIHGTSLQISGYPPGFKVVRFETMFDADRGLMPWVVEAVAVPSIGIIGRWRDRTEARGVAIEGPYVLWRDRFGDHKLREALLKSMQSENPDVRRLARETVAHRTGKDADEVSASWQQPEAQPREASRSTSDGKIAYVVVEATS